jgi:hypothetical protein
MKTCAKCEGFGFLYSSGEDNTINTIKHKKKICDQCNGPQKAYQSLLNNPNHPDKEALEKIIAEDAVYSYFYAIKILNAPFPLGETVINQHIFYKIAYRNHFKFMTINHKNKV